MKKSYTFLKILIIIIVIMAESSHRGFAQTMKQKKNAPVFRQSIGVQFNPYLDQSFFNGDIKQYVFAARYIFENKKGISFGPEFSGHYGHSNAFKWYTLNFGAFFRYTFLLKKKVSPFVEVSGYYQWGKIKTTDSSWWLLHNDSRQNNENENQRFGYYVAPGFSVALYKEKLTLDFFIKCSTDTFLNGRNFVPSIRIVYHF